MRRVWFLLAFLAVAAVVALYLAERGPSRRAAPATGPQAEAPAEPAAPEAPSDPAAPAALVVVRDADGKGIPGATVGVYTERKFEGETVTTGVDGRCRLPMDGDGWKEIAARHPDFVQEQTYVKAGPDEFEIVLERGVGLTVIVVDPARQPLAGAKVDASFSRTHGASGFWQWSDVTELARTVTDADGRARVGAVPEGAVTIAVDREPFALHFGGVTVTGDAPVEHVVTLDAGGILVGRVVGPQGEGVPGAKVQTRGMARPVVLSEADGAFRLEGVVAGQVEVIASAEGYGPGFFGAALGWGQPVPVPVRSGATVDGIEIVLSKPTFVTGRIVDDAGSPVEGVDVQSWLQRGFALDRAAKSDKEGRFRAGPFSVREACAVYLWFLVSGYTIEQKQVEVKPGADADAGTILATRQATVRGVVVDGAGLPAKASVSTGHMFTESQADGTFELKGVGPGTVVLSAAAGPADLRGETRGLSDEAMLRSRPVKVETVAGAVVEGVEIVLLPTKPIRGRVITPDGKPRPNALIGIKGDGPGILERTHSDAEGKFAFEHLVDDEYTVGLVRSSWVKNDEEGVLPEPPPVTVSAGREDLEFIVPIKGGIVLGKVVGKRDGLPIKEFSATFLRYKLFIPSDTEWASFKNGEFRYETGEPGSWQVDISSDGLASHRTERFNLSAGEVKDLGTIRLGPGGTIAGRVLDAQQRPVPYTRINILNEKLQTNQDEPFTDFDGRFEVKGVSPGQFTVFAVSPRHPLGMVRGVDVREGERTEVQIAFVDPAPLTIDVRDSSGQPVEGAALDFTFPAVAPLTSKLFRGKIPPGYGSHRSDASGTIFQPCLPPGEVTITIELKGFESVTKKLDLKPGEPNRVEIRLRRVSG
jgi:hypothetical protein